MYVKHSNCCSIQSGNGNNLNTKKKIEVKKNKKIKKKSQKLLTTNIPGKFV